MGKDFLNMLAPNWEDHDAEKNPIMNYFVDRQHTEIILRKIENKINKRCFYCQVCENCQKLKNYKDAFKQQGFWTFNKEIKYWNVYDPDWCTKNKIFKLLPIRTANFKV